MPVILTTDEERVRGPESLSFAHEDELARPPDYYLSRPISLASRFLTPST
jgi:hypothetical protein